MSVAQSHALNPPVTELGGGTLGHSPASGRSFSPLSLRGSTSLVWAVQKERALQIFPPSPPRFPLEKETIWMTSETFVSLCQAFAVWLSGPWPPPASLHLPLAFLSLEVQVKGPGCIGSHAASRDLHGELTHSGVQGRNPTAPYRTDSLASAYLAVTYLLESSRTKAKTELHILVTWVQTASET